MRQSPQLLTILAAIGVLSLTSCSDAKDSSPSAAPEAEIAHPKHQQRLKHDRNQLLTSSTYNVGLAKTIALKAFKPISLLGILSLTQ